ncbi:NVEALA domain-containing protein [Proteiniphilum propionicum]|uniref:NVEALA domain-containing protein n=1 Tax=Proteiniphilum propionicum TaxID=2829812 RepID=UPI0021127398|nr:NVEALA domain-containing protein [Proteiniphilum propionicum]
MFALAILAATGYSVNKSMKSDTGLSDLALANVEALAQYENDPPSRDKWTKMSFQCLDSNGNPTGKTYISCIKTGYLDSCTSTSC